MNETKEIITFTKSACAVGMNGDSSTGNVNLNKMAPFSTFGIYKCKVKDGHCTHSWYIRANIISNFSIQK